MKRAHYLIISILFSGACRQQTNQGQVQMAALRISLDRNNKFVSWQIDNINRSLQNKRSDARTAEAAKNWISPADGVGKVSKEMYTYLSSLRSALKDRAHIVSDTAEFSAGWGEKDPVYELFEKEGRKKELSKKIAAYHKTILDLWRPDSLLVSDAQKEDVKTVIPKMISNVPENIIERFDPANTTTATAYIMLDQIENDLLLAEHEMIRYADLHIGFIDDGAYEELSILTGVNSSYLKAGQTLTIDAGVGRFSLAAAPKITINSIPVKMDAGGLAEYSIIVGNIPGMHTIPVKIECVRPDGSPMTVKKNIKYEIAP